MTLISAAFRSRPRRARQFFVCLAASALALAGCGGSGGGGTSTDAPGAEKPQLRCAP